MREDPWLAARIGCGAWWIEDGDLGPFDEPGFYQARVDADRVDRVQELEAAGFRTVDLTVTLRRAGSAPTARHDFDVTDARPADTDALLAIAHDDYTVSRFHLDPAIPDGTARAIKRDWVAAYLAGKRGERLLVARAAGEPVGFLAELHDGETRMIDLIAVATRARGGGAGTALVARFLSDAPGECVVGTQAANIRALAFYERLGFEASSAQFVLHRHAG